VSTPAASGRFAGVVAVDGPSGAGKSTVSRRLALRLGARYLDTGAMYRAVTWAVLRAGISLTDPAAIAHLTSSIRLDVITNPDQPGVAVDGRSVNEEIRSPAVTRAVSEVSAVAEVRRHLVELQRELIGAGSIVVEGRDIGTVVAPEAELKVFLTASADARAQRRSNELGATGTGDLAATAADLTRRDRLDSTRAASPLQPPTDAILIDTTQLGIAEVVERLAVLAMGDASDGSPHPS
jgi:cytidylate kinase